MESGKYKVIILKSGDRYANVFVVKCSLSGKIKIYNNEKATSLVALADPRFVDYAVPE